MKQVMILTGISLEGRESANRKALRGTIRTIKASALTAVSAIRRNYLSIGIVTGASSFLGILLGAEFFGSVMAMVTLSTLWMGEEGGRK